MQVPEDVFWFATQVNPPLPVFCTWVHAYVMGNDPHWDRGCVGSTRTDVNGAHKVDSD